MRHKLRKSSHDSRTRDRGLHVYSLEPNKTGTIRGNKYVSGVVSGQWIRFMPWSIKFVRILTNICKPDWIACRLIVGNKFSIRLGLKSGASNINTNHNVCTCRHWSHELRRDIIVQDALLGVISTESQSKRRFSCCYWKCRIESKITTKNNHWVWSNVYAKFNQHFMKKY